MRKFTVLLLAVFAVSLNIVPIYARGRKPVPDKDIKGTVTVIKSGETITAIEITTDDKTVYEINIDTKGQQLAKDYAGKPVEIKGKETILHSKKTITIDKIVTDASTPKPKK